MGCSDTTVLNIALWQATGLVTLNGPALLLGFAEHPEMLDYTRRSFLDATFEAQPFRTIGPAARCTDETLEWSTQADLSRPRTPATSDGWT
jgi:muramoyltetrapeptide carboxypeptidase LdcA involved in peptidoglycan recycling